MSEYEKKRDEAALNAYPISRDGEYFDLKFQKCFKAGSDFGREYQRGVGDVAVKELIQDILYIVKDPLCLNKVDLQESIIEVLKAYNKSKDVK